MIVNFFLFLLFSFPQNEDKDFWYSKFLAAMYSHSGVSFNAMIDQKQFDLNSSISAYVEVIDSLHLLIEIDQKQLFCHVIPFKLIIKKQISLSLIS